jgi:ABC-type Fe3+ transport system substrate-binding protein
MKFSKIIAAVLMSVAIVPAAQAIDQDMIDAAKNEGEVVWYTGMIVNQVVRPIANAFEAKYPGIKVNAARYLPAEIFLKVQNETAAGQVMTDVFDGSTTAYPMIKAGLVEPYVPEAAAIFPETDKDPDGYWTAANLYMLVPAVNTTMVAEADYPKTFEDLLDPKWKGKMVWTSDVAMSGAPGFIYSVLQVMGEEAGMDYLKKLAEQDIVNQPVSQRVVLDKVIAGEYPLALMTFNNHSLISATDGAPVEWIRFDPVIQMSNTVGIVKNAPHPNAAKLLIEFILSEEGQKVIQGAMYVPASPNVAAADPALKPEEGGFNVSVISPEDVAVKLDAMVAIYNELFK